ncbi:MAG TPA: hypothetical protein VLW85_17090 [Myxococcales bacterium]|nr:hypothetical protein [Myxococcales bacterium]
MKKLLLLCLSACASASPRPPSCTAPAEQVEVAQIQIGWNALVTGVPTQPPVVDVERPVRYEKDAQALAKQLLARCEKGEPLAPLQQQYSEKGPGTMVIDAGSEAPFRSAALCMKPGECALYRSAEAWHVLKRIN